MTEKRLEIDSLGGGSEVVGDESRGWAVAEKQFHYLIMTKGYGAVRVVWHC